MTQSLVLVTGGAGFLGINLCRHLLQRGYRVRSMDIAPFDYPERAAVDIRQSDIRDRTAVAHALQDVSFVVHCAAALPRAAPSEIFSTNVAGTTVLLESAAACGIARFVFISSTAVYGIPDHHPIVESDPLRGVGPYGESKIQAEQACERFRQRNLCIPILRPKTFVGPERLGAFELLYRWAYEGRGFPVLGSGDNPYQLLDVADLCEVISRCLEADASIVNRTFNVGAAIFTSMRANFQAVLDRAGHGARVVCLPRVPAVWTLRALNRMHLSPLYPWIYETASRESFVSIEALRTGLDFVPRQSNLDALVRNYDWYVAHRDDYRFVRGVTHRVPWRHGALALAKLFF
jgi:nucleoside-diphosphate-sugar epimerase